MKKLIILVVFIILNVGLFANQASIQICGVIPQIITVEPSVETNELLITSNAENVIITYDDPAIRVYDDSFFAGCKTAHEVFLLSSETGIYPESYRNVVFACISGE